MTDQHAVEDLYSLITAPEDPEPRRPRRRKQPWPARAAQATGRFILVSASCLAVAAVAGNTLHLGGDLKLPGFLAAATEQHAPAAPGAEPAPAMAAAPSATPPVTPSVHGRPAPHRPPAPARDTLPGTAAGPTVRSAADRPTPGRDVHPGPLGKPEPFAAGSTSYKFLHLQGDGTPVTYDPCRRIHYVTRAANAPAGGSRLIREAVTAVSRATGLVFIDDGPTTEAPAAKHASYQPARYGDRWAPVLIAWETSAEEPRFTNPEFGATVLGLGGSEAVSVGDTPFTYVSGQLELNGPALARMVGRDGAAAARGVIEHELAHLVGLDHVNDPAQLMNPSATATVTSYAAGDLSGLAILGQGRCAPGL